MRGFLFGAMVGALVAVLVAPRRGEETRGMVRARFGVWQDQLTAKVDTVAADVESMRHEMMARLEDIRAQFGGGAGVVGNVVVQPSGTASMATGQEEVPPEPPTPGA